MEKRKEQEPKCLAVPFVADQSCFPAIGDVRVAIVIALMRMMLEMIHAEPDRSGEKVGEIGTDRDEFVPTLSLENEVVGRIVNDDVDAVIQKRTQTKGDEQA